MALPSNLSSQLYMEVEDYHAHFEAAYGWDYATKVLYLAVSLRVN